MAKSLAYLGPLEKEGDIIYRFINSRGPVAVDTETVSLKNNQPVGIGVQISDEDRYYFRVFPEPSEYLGLVIAMLEDKDRTKIYHNAKFDLEVLESICNPEDISIEDTYLMVRCMGLPAGLQFIGENLLGFNNLFSIQDLIEQCQEIGIKRPTMLDVGWEGLAQKCMNDVLCTWEGYKWLQEHMDIRMKECYEVDRQLIHLLRDMEKKGLGLNQDLLWGKHQELTYKCESFELTCYDLGFNPGSNQQVGMYLAQAGIVLPLTRSKKSLSVDEETLEGVDHPIADQVLQYRKSKKLLSTYIDPWLGESRATTKFRGDLSTGRLASYDRNLQNIPPDMRIIFVPDNGIFTWIDYSQIEMRLFAYLSGDQNMLWAYAQNEDIHYITQSTLWPGSSKDDENKRTIAKTFNFAMIYLAKAGTLAAHTKLPYQTANRYRNLWLSLYPQGHQWMLEQTELEEPYSTTMFGRRMRLPDEEINPVHVQKCRINYPIQGTAADIIKRAMLRLYELGDMRLQVHDELVFDGNVQRGIFDRARIEDILEGLKLPFGYKQGRIWM